ncbi:hypothetical protein D9M72_438010 [compost metagenome]
MLTGPAVLAESHKRLDQDGVAVRMERIAVQRQRRQLRRLGGSAGSQSGQRGLVQQGLGAVVQPVALVRKPRIKDWRVGEGQPLQQLAAETSRINAGPASPVHHFQRIAAPRRLQGQPQGIAGHGDAVERPAKLGQVPAQGTERVRRIRKQQRRRAGPAGAVRLQREVGQQGPGLAASGLRGSCTGGLDRWRTEEPNPILGHTAHGTPRAGRRLLGSHVCSHAGRTH